MAYIKDGEKQYEIPDGSTAEETLASLAMVQPDLANAKVEKEGSHYIVTRNYGRKG